MAHAAAAGDGDGQRNPGAFPGGESEREAGRAAGREGAWKGRTEQERQEGSQAREARTRGEPRRADEEAGPMVRLFLGAGRKAGIRPGDLVGRDHR